jgi:hypothetical protein
VNAITQGTDPAPGPVPATGGRRVHWADVACIGGIVLSGVCYLAILWHNGGTGGFSSMLALDCHAGCAIAAVATSSPARNSPLDSAVFAALTDLTSRIAQQNRSALVVGD